MKLYDFTLEDQEYIKKLAMEHPISTHEAMELFKLGRYNHSKDLCEMKSMGRSDTEIKVYSDMLWQAEQKAFDDALQGAFSRLSDALSDLSDSISSEIKRVWKKFR